MNAADLLRLRRLGSGTATTAPAAPASLPAATPLPHLPFVPSEQASLFRESTIGPAAFSPHALTAFEPTGILPLEEALEGEYQDGPDPFLESPEADPVWDGPVLSEDQVTAQDQLRVAIARGDKVLVLAGAAGTGKSTLVRSFVGTLRGRFAVVYAAPTGKAASRLQELIREPVVTVHKLLYGRPVSEGQCQKCEAWSPDMAVSNYALGRLPEDMRYRQCAACGEQHWPEKQTEPIVHRLAFGVPNNKREAALSNTLIVIDEASMVNEQMFQDVLRLVRNGYQCHVLYIGDPYQLPPVNAKVGPNFETPTASLLKVHRQALDSPVLAAATDLRSFARKKPFEGISSVPDFQLHQDADVFEAADWLATRRNAGVDATLIVYTNALRHSLNDSVRELRGLKALAEANGTGIVAGDRLMVQSNQNAFGMMNGEVFEVEGVEWVPPLTYVQEHEVLRVQLRNRPEPILVAVAVFGDEYRDFASYLRGHERHWDLAKEIEQGRDEIEDPFSDAGDFEYEPMRLGTGAVPEDVTGTAFEGLLDPSKFVHCGWGEVITAHKSQGSAYDEVGIVWNKSCWGLWYKGESTMIQGQSVSEGRRWAYTAITRAVKSVNIWFTRG
jgi:hypothetical protein